MQPNEKYNAQSQGNLETDTDKRRLLTFANYWFKQTLRATLFWVLDLVVYLLNEQNWAISTLQATWRGLVPLSVDLQWTEESDECASKKTQVKFRLVAAFTFCEVWGFAYYEVASAL